MDRRSQAGNKGIQENTVAQELSTYLGTSWHRFQITADCVAMEVCLVLMRMRRHNNVAGLFAEKVSLFHVRSCLLCYYITLMIAAFVGRPFPSHGAGAGAGVAPSDSVGGTVVRATNLPTLRYLSTHARNATYPRVPRYF